MFGREDDSVTMLDDEGLRNFYREICNGVTPVTVPLRLEVEDLEGTLGRIWDLGGTIVSVSVPDDRSEAGGAATFSDPRGNLVTIVQARASAAV